MIKLLEDIATNQERQIKAEEDFVGVISHYFQFEKRTRIEKIRKEQEEALERKGTKADELY
jgi:hypothetical protein